MTDKKTHKRLAGTVLALGGIVGGIGNISLVKRADVEIRQYHADRGEAEAAEIQADNAADPLRNAYAQIGDAITQAGKDSQALYNSDNRNMGYEARSRLSDRIKEDERQVAQRKESLIVAQQKAIFPGSSPARDRASLLEVKSDEDSDKIYRTGAELAMLNGFLAFGAAKLRSARRKQKVDDCLAGIEARASQSEKTETSYRAQYEAEIKEYMKGRRSL